jgi:hypothetical protein
MRALISFLAGVTMCLPPTPGLAQDEPGDYSAARTLLNVILPPAADNPVTPAQRTDVWPLLANPAGFDDGFEPGAYLRWQTITLHPSTGAVCGNGTPYKFFINRAPGTSNMLIYMEGGGACWDYGSCTGGELLGARNPDGIPDDYMNLQNPSASLVSPFIFRLHPYSRSKVQDWTLVYLPYCTGDVYSGDRIAVYDNPDPTGHPLVWHHNGLRNVRAMLSWLKDNVQRPTQLLSTGCSAGGTGSLTNYYHLRRDLAPDFARLLDDSGPLFPTAASDSRAFSPSLPLHTRIRELWGLDDDGLEGISPLAYIGSELPDLDLDDLGTLYRGLAARFPDDRIGHTHFWQDYNYSRYSYEDFYEFIGDAATPALQELLTKLLWYSDTAALIDELSQLDNVGYYLPSERDLNDSHCSTIVDFRRGDIQEAGLELADFIDDVMDGQGPVMQASESDWATDRARPRDPLYRFVDSLLQQAQ